jgi:hypothetical protein
LLICDKDKQWPLKQHLPNLLITQANLARQMSFFSKKRIGKCEHFGEYHVMAFGKFLSLASPYIFLFLYGHFALARLAKFAKPTKLSNI